MASPSVGVVMRFKDSATTLPRVLDALFAQSRPPDLLVGVDTGATDGSRDLLAARGARFVDWDRPYHVSRVLNAGIAACPTDHVLVLSSHTALDSRDALERYVAALADPTVAAVSPAWPGAAPAYGERIAWADVARIGMTWGTIYSNSLGMLRRARWEEVPFDESIRWGVEDYHWALAQARRGHAIALLPGVAFSYLRPRTPPGLRVRTLRMLLWLQAHHGLRLRWHGPARTGLRLGAHGACALATLGLHRRSRGQAIADAQDLWAWATWRGHAPLPPPDGRPPRA